MIVETKDDRILKATEEHIAVPVNVEGINTIGEAAIIARRHLPKMANTGPKELGDTMTITVKEADKIFHFLVCYSLKDWGQTPEIITQCLDALDVPMDKPIAIRNIGSSANEQLQGANPGAILAGIESSLKRLVVYHG